MSQVAGRYGSEVVYEMKPKSGCFISGLFFFVLFLFFKVLNSGCNGFSFGVHCVEEGDRIPPLQSYGRVETERLFLWCPG